MRYRNCFKIASSIFLAIFIESSASGQKTEIQFGDSAFQPTTEHPFGWRGDGNGRFPAANPPLTWGRLAQSVKELVAQSKTPKPGDKGAPLSEGLIRDWLTLGPVPIPEGKTAKDDFGTDEAKFAPTTGDKVGSLEWKAITLDTAWLDFWPMYNNATKDGKGLVAYAHTWIYSAEGKPVFLNLMLSGSAKVWVNGNDLGGFVVKGLQDGQHLLVPLQKGWNRLLLRVAPLDDVGWSKGVIQWHFNAAFFGTDKSDYESRNIIWSTPMPDNGPGVGSPISVGDKLFVPVEAATLLCVSAKDGKVLWARSSTYADAATPKERQEHPEVFAEIDPLQAKIKDTLQAYCNTPEKYFPNVNLLSREQVENTQKITQLLKKMDSGKYPGQSYPAEAGESGPTPVSDGQNVYVLYGSGLVACFDLSGTRIWTTIVDIQHREHGYSASPCLVNDKLIIKASSQLGAVILNSKTGAVVTPVPLWKSKGLHSMSSPLSISVGSERLIVQSFGVITQVKDGKILAQRFTPPYYNIADYVSPATEGRTVCSYILAENAGGIRFAFQTLPDSITDPLVMKDTKECEYNLKAFPCWFSYDHCAAPLLYQGLAYILSVDGVLTVIDATKGELVYQKLLDLSPFMKHHGIIRAGCSSSPTLGGKYIYIWDNQGSTIVIEPGRQFKQVAKNRIEQLYFRYGPERNESTISNPIFSGNRIFYRGEVNLYCIGPKDK